MISKWTLLGKLFNISQTDGEGPYCPLTQISSLEYELDGWSSSHFEPRNDLKDIS